MVYYLQAIRAEGTMSEAAQNVEYSGYTFPFESPEEAHLVEQNNIFKSPVARALEEAGIVRVESGLSGADYAEVADTFTACLENCPEALKSTWHLVDRRFGNNAGYTRRERKVNPQTGVPERDAKNVFHFNEHARLKWEEDFRLAPADLRVFLNTGYEVHNQLLRVARLAVVGQLEPTHPGITNAIFPPNGRSVSFYRHVDYDGYDIDPDEAEQPVALPHLDIAWITLHGNATAPGFYGIAPDGTKVYYDEHDGSAYAFMSASHRKLYGDGSFIRPLPHGVDRITPPDATSVGRRKSDILFLNPWKIDCGITPADTKQV